MTDPHFPQIITFYSYKGGVGRSMAMMNVAFTLAGWGRHVLMVDMDLEAPGVGGFLERNDELEPQPEGQKDLLTLLGEVKRLAAKVGNPEELATQIAPVSHFIRSVKAEKLETLKPELGQVGRLDLLGPDLHRNFATRLTRLQLHGHSQAELVEMGRILHFYCKAQRFPFVPDWLKEYESPRPTPYDYILIDSRTGITEIGGLCIGPFAEKLVVITGLNDQNIEGTASFLKLTGIQPQPKSDEPGDDTNQITLGPKPTILVASPAPLGEIAYRQERLNTMEQRLGAKPVRLSYHPLLALMETNFVRDLKDEYLAIEYRSLTGRILSMAEDTPQSLNQVLSGRVDPSRFSNAIQSIVRLAPQVPQMAITSAALLANTMDRGESPAISDRIRIHSFLSQFPGTRTTAITNLGRALSDQAKTKSGPEADSLFYLASQKFAEATRLQPNDADTFTNWGTALSVQAKTKSGPEADSLFAQASEKYAEATRLNPDHADAYNNWGNALGEQAKVKSDQEAELFFTRAFQNFAEAIRLHPSHADAFNNWGGTLYEQAKRKTSPDADSLLVLAIQKFADAIRINPQHAGALYNWGNALWEQAKTKSGSEADFLFAQAYEKYADSIRFQPDLPDSYFNWAVAISEQAKTKFGTEANALFALASEKFAEAVRLRPSHAGTLNNWSAALIFRSYLQNPQQAEQSLSQAVDCATKAEALQPGSAKFNQACIASIRNQPEAALSALREARKFGTLPNKQHLQQDKDLNNIRHTPEFQAFLAELPEK